MKRWLWMTLLFSSVFMARADEPAISQEVCRSDDPFVYCTQGCKETKAWKPAKPYASIAYKPEPGYCPLPMTGQCCFGNVCFEPWSQSDYKDYMEKRVVLCPKAHQAGDWDRQDGQGEPEDTDTSH